ncbi:hypothetical protein CAURIC_08545 [Corynebacterium auriscanis]|nr:hypothetical protein CAURIC_08545 [Corynebacterium auriscanis]
MLEAQFDWMYEARFGRVHGARFGRMYDALSNAPGAGILALYNKCAAEVQQKWVILSEFCCTLCERVRSSEGCTRLFRTPRAPEFLR